MRVAAKLDSEGVNPMGVKNSAFLIGWHWGVDL